MPVSTPIEKVALIWLDGKLINWDDAQIHLLTHSLHYGSGIFEGLRCHSTPRGPAIFRLRDHMQRFVNSARLCGMPLPYGFDALCDAVIKVVKANKLSNCYIRPIAFYSYGEMGVDPSRCRVSVGVAAWRWGPYYGEAAKRGVRVKISSWLRIDRRCVPTHAKACGVYLNSLVAKLEALRLGYDEAILLNSFGHVAECTGTNIFVVKNGALVTPPLSAGILPGITRDSVLQIARSEGISALERNLVRDELLTCDEAFLTGSAAGITPIREIDGVAMKAPGEVTKAIKELYERATTGRDRRFLKWLTFVK